MKNQHLKKAIFKKRNFLENILFIFYLKVCYSGFKAIFLFDISSAVSWFA